MNSVWRYWYKKIKRQEKSQKRPRLNKWMARAFQRQYLLPVPDDWKIGNPSFIGIGCPKAGTTWWFRLLLEHPSVKPNRLDTKDLFYFFHFGYHAMDTTAIEIYRQ